MFFLKFYPMGSRGYKMILWFTGLPCSGKSTIANKLKEKYPEFLLLNGDNIRKGLCKDLGFSVEDRRENMRRIIELCKILNAENINLITDFISPFEKYREQIRNIVPNTYIIYCKADLEVCEKRDVKGMYKKARDNKIKNFTGIDSPYQIPKKPDLILDTKTWAPGYCINKVEEIIYEHINNR